MTEREWLECELPRRMQPQLKGRAGRRESRLFAVACCRRVWPLLLHPAARTAVEVAEQYADGLAGKEALKAARRAAAAAWGEMHAAGPAAFVAEKRAARAAANAACVAEHSQAASEFAVGAIMTRAGLRNGILDHEALCAARAEERRAQCRLLRCIFGNPFRPCRVDPAWLRWNGRAVGTLATLTYEARQVPAGTLDPARLALLADALEDAGCADAEILQHLRDPGPHVPGCWCVDLLRGKRRSGSRPRS